MSLSFSKMKLAVDIVLKSGHVPNIVGLQGIGKSDLVREYAQENAYGYREITCSLVQEGDMAMPYISKVENGQEVKYAINSIITSLQQEILDGKYAKGLLFFDEFNRGTSNVQSELMNVVLQREIAGYHLDNRIMVVLAMNPSSEMKGYEDTEYTVSFSDNAVLGRVDTLHLEPNVVDWLAYGEREDSHGNTLVHPSVLSFLSGNTNYFITKEVSGSVNNTPRGWRRASDILYAYDASGMSDKLILRNLLEGTLDSNCVPVLMRHLQSNNNLSLVSVAKGILDGSIATLKYSGYTDVEKNNIFTLMMQEIYKMGTVPTEVETRFVEFILVANNSLSHSWMSLLATDHADLYAGLIQENVEFANYALSMLDSVKGRERGGFNGK